MWHLRQESEADWWAVEALFDLCFAPGREALSSYRLREGVAPVATLSMVAVDPDGVIGGAIRFWPVCVGAARALLLGPIAVHPTRQGEGLGAGLIRETLDRARALGWPRVLLVGDAPYYGRFGFARLDGVEMPPPTNPDRVLGVGDWRGIAGTVSREAPDGRRSAEIPGRRRADCQCEIPPSPLTPRPRRRGALAGGRMTGTDLVPAPAVEARIAALAARYNQAGGLGLRVLNLLGTRAETLLEGLPDPVKDQLESATRSALAIAVDAAQASRGWVPDQSSWLDRAVTTAMGAAGGFGGLPSALTELPVTTTLLLRTIQGVARSHGFDPADPAVRAECLTVFAAAGPLERDDGANMAFLAARVTLTGKGVQTILARVAPRLATVLGQKLAAQTVPVLGAAAGAATNYAYTSYYQEIAEVHFGLRALTRDHGIAEEALRAAFVAQAARLRGRGPVAGA